MTQIKSRQQNLKHYKHHTENRYCYDYQASIDGNKINSLKKNVLSVYYVPCTFQVTGPTAVTETKQNKTKKSLSFI